MQINCMCDTENGWIHFSTHLIAKTQMLPTLSLTCCFFFFFDAAGFQSIQAQRCQDISVCLNATCEISPAES